MKERY